MTEEIKHDKSFIDSLHNCDAACVRESNESAKANGINSSNHIILDGEDKSIKDYIGDQQIEEEKEGLIGEVKVEVEIGGGTKAPDGGWGWFVVLGRSLFM